MQTQARQLLNLLNRLGLWVALPLLLAVLPYQQASLHPSGQAAVSAQVTLALVAPLKPSFVKPSLPETRVRAVPVLASTTPLQPPHRPGFRLLAEAEPTHPTVTQIRLGWQARAPPRNPTAAMI